MALREELARSVQIYKRTFCALPTRGSICKAATSHKDLNTARCQVATRHKDLNLTRCCKAAKTKRPTTAATASSYTFQTKCLSLITHLRSMVCTRGCPQNLQQKEKCSKTHVTEDMLFLIIHLLLTRAGRMNPGSASLSPISYVGSRCPAR